MKDRPLPEPPRDGAAGPGAAAVLPFEDPVWRPALRYADQPMSWQTRFFGVGGITAITAVVLFAMLFSWTVYKAAPPAPRLSVFDVEPPAAPPEPPSEVPPGPVQVERRLPTPERPDIEPPIKVQLPSTVPPPPAPPAEPGPQGDRTTAPEKKVEPPAPKSSAGKPTWQGQVLAALNKAKRYPRDARFARQQGVPYIRFTMDRTGRVLSVRLERSSGVSSLDREALSLPKRAQPLPAPPEDVSGDPLELVVPVEFFIR